MKRTKHNPPKEKKKPFIEFSKVQQNYLTEVRTRQLKEFNEAVQAVFEELGILEKIKKAPGRYRLKMDDLSGIDIVPEPPKPPTEEELKLIEEAEKLAKKKAEEKKLADVKGKGGKTH